MLVFCSYVVPFRGLRAFFVSFVVKNDFDPRLRGDDGEGAGMTVRTRG